MNKNTYEKSLVKVDNSILGRIKLFFKNLFKSNIQESMINKNIIVEQEKSNTIEENNFVNNIKVQENKQNLRLKKMSKDLESGKIIEEDLCEQELQELREFYLQQIEEKKQSIENYKNRIIRIKAQLA
jgi:hypothetical protein